MAHYALLDENNIVVSVTTGVDEEDTSTLPAEFSSWEEFYTDVCSKEDDSIKDCKRTSYNTWQGEHKLGGTPFRGNYCGPGDIYDSVNDIFHQPKEHDSWTMNTTKWDWEAPIACPEPTEYDWIEEEYQNDTADPKTKGWVLKPHLR
tara:strand:- start:1776 stop:2216 length:441 start_codon:yes stop_codon:yes gene_type:complete